MMFDDLLAQVLDILQRQGRVSYRALKRRFDFDDDHLEDLKTGLIKAQRLAVDEDGECSSGQGEPGRCQRASSNNCATHARTRPHILLTRSCNPRPPLKASGAGPR
jgi:hypothetical protein